MIYCAFLPVTTEIWMSFVGRCIFTRNTRILVANTGQKYLCSSACLFTTWKQQCKSESSGEINKLKMLNYILYFRIFGFEGQEAKDVCFINWLNMVRAGLLGLEFYTPSSKTWRQVLLQIVTVYKLEFIPVLLHIIELYSSVSHFQSSITVYLFRRLLIIYYDCFIGEHTQISLFTVILPLCD